MTSKMEIEMMIFDTMKTIYYDYGFYYNDVLIELIFSMKLKRNYLPICLS